jgi:hypothetical protein
METTVTLWRKRSSMLTRRSVNDFWIRSLSSSTHNSVRACFASVLSDIHRHTDTQTHRHTYTDTNRQTDTHTNRHTYTHTPARTHIHSTPYHTTPYHTTHMYTHTHTHTYICIYIPLLPSCYRYRSPSPSEQPAGPVFGTTKSALGTRLQPPASTSAPSTPTPMDIASDTASGTASHTLSAVAAVSPWFPLKQALIFDHIAPAVLTKIASLNERFVTEGPIGRALTPTQLDTVSEGQQLGARLCACCMVDSSFKSPLSYASHCASCVLRSTPLLQCLRCCR